MTNPPSIVVVDDDRIVRASLASLIRSMGYNVQTFGSGLQFLQEMGQREPDCMVVDIQMPGIAGDELQAKLIAAGRQIPMIFVTGFPTESMRRRVMEAGAFGYLEKPPDADTISACLKTALSSKA
ncbi:response regulator transcription factor [Bradyrhizobium ganzhouense]|uniref:response regulator transcription factor n=1 Tax=Bradyrhizobium ganzhouense TaxID=1179767 RepID=UPI003CEC8201